jgi:hypothetical protein
MKAFGYVCAIVLFVLFCLLISVVGFGWDWAKGLYRQTATPELAVDRYEWYVQQLKDIKAMESQLKFAQEELNSLEKNKETTFDERAHRNVLAANVTGLKQARSKMIQDYNAKAAMITRNMWQHPSLPQHLEE